jgi:hypothetical protein
MADSYKVLTEAFQISFVIGEMKEPQHTLPRVLNSSMAIVITLFTLSTFAFYNTLSLEMLQKTNAIAVVSRHSLISFYPGYLNLFQQLMIVGVWHRDIWTTRGIILRLDCVSILPRRLECHSLFNRPINSSCWSTTLSSCLPQSCC